ncbi:HDIG domain-containing metalloprotein [Dysgonomonas massiliensis]|uniref:HDIG domain-containing metalloprotein n=1 Tax=Dysgonomonas massiliensis TaxID=2040292 RepID=UPI000C76EE14|nr:HDIG domain-containing metalloprotein [Dysgonomonas massiliensis]
MNPLDIIEKYYDKNSDLYKLLVKHSAQVMNKALSIAKNHPELNTDTQFISEAAMLHDIGIYLTNAPSIFCHGKKPYICHGYLGADILRNEGLPKHALVCERHTGTGLSVEDIERQKLPLPLRDMIPISIEEQIICFADCFFSKSGDMTEKSVDKVRAQLSKFGTKTKDQFDYWCEIFL